MVAHVSIRSRLPHDMRIYRLMSVTFKSLVRKTKGGCRLSRKTLLILFSLIFVSGLLIRIFISPILWPSIPEVVDPLRIVLSSIAVFSGLSICYYVRVHAGPKGIRLFYTITIGLSLGFGIWLAAYLLYQAVLGQRPPDFLFLLMFVIAYIIALYIGDMIGKRRVLG